MRILIDLQGAQSASRHRGIGRSTLAHALAMARNRGEHEVFILLNGLMPESIRPIRDAFAPWLPQSHIRVWHAVPPIDASQTLNNTRREVAGLLRDDVIRQIQPDVLHVGSLFDGFGDEAIPDIWPRTHSALVAVTFHDAIPLIHREIYLAPNPDYEAYYLAQAKQLAHADLVLSVSASAREEAIEHLGVPAAHAVNMSSAVDDAFHVIEYSADQTKRLQHSLGIHKSFVMYSGATDERKNHRGLIEAFALLPPEVRSKHQLVLAGGLPDEHRKQLEAHARSHQLRPDDVVITGRISDDDMIQLYNQCALYVFASWHEGFGLPALEAMACGAATIGANTTSVPEVIGWERAMFDPRKPASIAAKMAEALTDKAFYQALKEHALTQSAQFSWDKSAQIAIAAMETYADKRAAGLDSQKPAELTTAVAQRIQGAPSNELIPLAQAMARNAKPAKRQLLVDVSELVQRDARTGIQRVVRSILHEWLVNPPQGYEVRAVYSTAEKLGYCYANQFSQRFLPTDASAIDSPIDYAAGDVFLALDMQPQVQVFQAPYLQRLRDDGVDVRFVIYDLLPISMSHYFPEGAKENHTRWVGVAAQTDGVLCISRAVAQEFDAWRQRHFPAACPKVDWFHMGADIESSAPSRGLPPDAADTLATLAARPTLLMVGTLEPRKGHSHVLDAADALWAEKDFNLVFVGKQGWDVEQLADRLRNHPQLGKRLHWLEGISDEYLNEIYARSDCLVAASFGEGFGLPLIEAAQRGLPIIARDIEVFREVAGEHALFFDTVENLKTVLKKWLDTPNLAPKSSEIPWLSWKESSLQLFEKLKPAESAILY